MRVFTSRYFFNKSTLFLIRQFCVQFLKHLEYSAYHFLLCCHFLPQCPLPCSCLSFPCIFLIVQFKLWNPRVNVGHTVPQWLHLWFPWNSLSEPLLNNELSVALRCYLTYFWVSFLPIYILRSLKGGILCHTASRLSFQPLRCLTQFHAWNGC